MSKGWAVFWFIFTIIINAIISFWIGNRFYKLSKKDNHLSFEIRALRKDIEEKFVNNVGGFSEQEVDIKNLNESLALDDEGLKPTAKRLYLMKSVRKKKHVSEDGKRHSLNREMKE